MKDKKDNEILENLEKKSDELSESELENISGGTSVISGRYILSSSKDEKNSKAQNINMNMNMGRR